MSIKTIYLVRIEVPKKVWNKWGNKTPFKADFKDIAKHSWNHGIICFDGDNPIVFAEFEDLDSAEKYEAKANKLLADYEKLIGVNNGKKENRN